MARTKSRVVETDEGIQGEFNVTIYDRMQKHLRDKGWIETNSIIASGINSGTALEIGPGPGYLGLEWLKKTTGTTLKGVEISPEMIRMAMKNARDYHLTERVEYAPGRAEEIPFGVNRFDAVFANGSLHEWSYPVKAFNEIYRVLKTGGKFFISDLKRNMSPLVKWFILSNTKPREIRPGFITSLNASYTKQELVEITGKSDLKNCRIIENFIGIIVTGSK